MGGVGPALSASKRSRMLRTAYGREEQARTTKTTRSTRTTSTGKRLLDMSEGRTLRIVYIHNHNCSVKDEEFVYFPSTRGSVALMERPICIEAMVELEEVKREFV